MTEALLTTAQTAERFGFSIRTLNNQRKTIGLVVAKRVGRSNLYDPADVERAIQKRTAKKARRTKSVDDTTLEQANAKMLDGLTGGMPIANTDTTPTTAEEAVIWAAYLRASLGPGSRWADREPPASYRRAYEAHEAARADAQADLELTA